MNFKHGDIIINVTDENLFNVYERAGFTPVTEGPEIDDMEELLEKAKELGIRNAHSMKRETLIKKIETATHHGAGE